MQHREPLTQHMQQTKKHTDKAVLAEYRLEGKYTGLHASNQTRSEHQENTQRTTHSEHT